MDPRLLDDTDADKLMAGVARLVFRHVEEGRPSGGGVQEGAPAGRGAVAAEDALRPRWRATGAARSGEKRQSSLVAADFDQALFFDPSGASRRWWRCCCCRPQEDTADTVFGLLRSIVQVSVLPKEVVVLSAIYIETLMARSAVRLTLENWRSALTAAILLASKVWEDVHPWNVDFAMSLARVGLRIASRSLYRLECKFLAGLGWHAGVSGEVYAAYYFALKEADTPATPPSSHYRRALPAGRFPRRSCSSHSWYDAALGSMDTIASNCGCEPRSIPSSSGSISTSAFSVARPGVLNSASSTTLASSSHPSLASAERSAEHQLSNLGHATTVSGDEAAVAVRSLLGRAEEYTRIRDMLWLDRTNPYVGSFRHAKRAMPPSRHINGRSWPTLAEQRAPFSPEVVWTRQKSL